jgi:hypothetical protein
MHRNGTGHCGQCTLPHSEHAGKQDKKECRLPGEFDPPRNQRKQEREEEEEKSTKTMWDTPPERG